MSTPDPTAILEELGASALEFYRSRDFYPSGEFIFRLRYGTSNRDKVCIAGTFAEALAYFRKSAERDKRWEEFYDAQESARNDFADLLNRELPL